jgi:hypothetical protein
MSQDVQALQVWESGALVVQPSLLEVDRYNQNIHDAAHGAAVLSLNHTPGLCSRCDTARVARANE